MLSSLAREQKRYFFRGSDNTNSGGVGIVLHIDMQDFSSSSKGGSSLKFPRIALLIALMATSSAMLFLILGGTQSVSVDNSFARETYRNDVIDTVLRDTSASDQFWEKAYLSSTTTASCATDVSTYPGPDTAARPTDQVASLAHPTTARSFTIYETDTVKMVSTDSGWFSVEFAIAVVPTEDLMPSSINRFIPDIYSESRLGGMTPQQNSAAYGTSGNIGVLPTSGLLTATISDDLWSLTTGKTVSFFSAFLRTEGQLDVAENV